MPTKHVLRKLPSSLREYGVRDTLSRLVTELAFDAFPHAFHSRRRPSLIDVYGAAEAVHLSASEFIANQLSPQGSVPGHADLLAEYEKLETELKNRSSGSKKAYPEFYAVERDFSVLLYAMVRKARPEILLETGVANGYSSYFILSALNKNGFGTLHSVDIASDVGNLVSPVEKERWHLHIFRTHRKKRFNALLKSLPRLDFFVHDSDHSYEWQNYEFRAVAPKLAEHAILASDDVGTSFAFLDFCARSGKPPLFLIVRDTIFGTVLPKPTAVV